MFDIVKQPQDDNRFIFYAGQFGGDTSAQYGHAWSKPKNIEFISIMCIGAGGGGAAGTSGASGTSRNGGGGGGSGGISSGIFPAFILPDTLYIHVGAGGAGATVSGGAGNTGGDTSVSVLLNSSVWYNILHASGGSPGSGVNAGIGATVSGNGNCPYSPWGVTFFSGGVSGSAGGTGAVNGTALTALNNHILSGGAGGGGTLASSQNGGSITARGPAPAVAGGSSTVGSASLPPWAGYSGTWFWKPMMFGTGGAGGQGVNINSGGYGGDGAYGCGGGGGGGGTAVGVGGDGGDGLVIIECW